MPEECGLIVDAKDYYTAFYRTALQARRYILLSGWQFDRGVELLRGEDLSFAEPAGGEVRLVKFLDGLCKARPELEVYILAWDFHVVFSLEREWMQRFYFEWATNERLHFRFDARHPQGGCHHQKFAVIDGTHSFLGGIDLCESRWDDRGHLANNPARVSRGAPQKPYHDVQAYFTGRAATRELVQLFQDRWSRADGEPLKLPATDEADAIPAFEPRGALPLPPVEMSFSRTDPKDDKDDTRESCFEIRGLLADAIAAADRLIYMENQYFSSRHLCDALEARMRAPGRPPLEIVLVTNARAEAVKEEIAVGLRQVQIIERLRKLAAETGHRFGAYSTVADGLTTNKDGAEEEMATYIHSKLSIIDDRFLSVGSANLTNRSMDLDTELNLSWECPPEREANGDADSEALETAIRRIRVSLMAEHIGGTAADEETLSRPAGLVDHLGAGRGRLRPLPPPTPDQAKALEVLDPQELPFDPEAEGGADHPLFRVGIAGLWDKLVR